uniref:MBT domain-containing protein 1-like n=1 Tax=Styela clava TaxID=7725 RepID=UPI001939F9D8|nr:MBT domain-containing protein 1-like [Styela clava]
MEVEEETAICEYCDKSGIREDFYSNSKRFCSAACSHSFSAQHRFNKHQTAPKLNPKKTRNLQLPSESERQQCISMGFDWGAYLVNKKSSAATVELFQHSPMSAHWGEIGSGMKVEVLNLDCNLNTKVFWIASVVQVAGYKAKLRYEGFGEDACCDFWCNLCTLDVHAVGWCATIGKPLVPPQTIQHKYTNWKTFLVRRLTGAKTLPNDFQRRVIESVKSQFLTNMRLEVVDKTKISRMRIGIIEEIVGGRLRLRYEDSDYVNDDFWCHSQSALIHPIGWCERVGHKILVASKDYKNKKGFKNAKQELFPAVKQVKSCGFKPGMKIEAIDPLNLSAICAATVKKVLKNGYLMIGIDGSEAADGSDWFCYHCTAPSIFPVGFCIENGISLSVPNAYKDSFTWETYLNETSSSAAPVELFDRDLPDHGFKRGMKLEAVDLMEPRLICVATVTRIVGRLLHVHFDGWENQYDQWVDCNSPDIYPVGWCELVGCELQAPPNMLVPEAGAAKKKKKLTGQTFGIKKKRKKSAAAQKKPIVTEAEQKSEQIIEEAKTEKMETEPTEGITTPADSEKDVKDDEKTSGESENIPEEAEIILETQESPQREVMESVHVNNESKAENREKEEQSSSNVEEKESNETPKDENMTENDENLKEINANAKEGDESSEENHENHKKLEETETKAIEIEQQDGKTEEDDTENKEIMEEVPETQEEKAEIDSKKQENTEKEETMEISNSEEKTEITDIKIKNITDEQINTEPNEKPQNSEETGNVDNIMDEKANENSAEETQKEEEKQ